MPRKKPPEPPYVLPCKPIISTMATHAISAVKSPVGESPTSLNYGGKLIEVRSMSDAVHLRPSTRKLFDYLLLLLTKYNSNRGDWDNESVCFTLQDYMDVMGCGFDRREKSRYLRVLCDDICKLGAIQLRQDDAGWFGLVCHCRLCCASGMKTLKQELIAGRAYFAVSFQKGLLAHLGEHRYIVPFTMKLFNITGQNENAYAIAKRLILHHNLNRNKSSKKQLRLSVEVLLKCCPNLADMPIGDMRRTLERALGCLSAPIYNPALLTCHYLIRGKTNVRELLSKQRLSKAEWDGLIIEFEFAHNLPDWGIFEDNTELDSAYELIDSMDVEYVLFDNGEVNADLLQKLS